MLSVEDARPCAERARWLKADADRKLLASLSYLGEVLARAGCPAERVGAAVDAGDQALADGIRLTASAYAFHNLLADAVRAGDMGRVLALTATLDPRHLVGEGLVISSQGRARDDPLVQNLFDALMEHEHEHEYEIAYDARAPSKRAYRRSRGDIVRVLDLLERHDPETFGEIAALVTDVVVIRSDEINAGSSFRVHGLVLLRELKGARDWTVYLENLVHEAAHLQLFLAWTQDPIFANGASLRRPSPLRRGARPLSGIFHAMFVLARTIRAARIFAAIPELSADVRRMSTSYNNRRNPAPFEQKFEEARASLHDAELTPVGKALLEGCVAMVREQ